MNIYKEGTKVWELRCSSIMQRWYKTLDEYSKLPTIVIKQSRSNYAGNRSPGNTTLITTSLQAWQNSRRKEAPTEYNEKTQLKTPKTINECLRDTHMRYYHKYWFISEIQTIYSTNSKQVNLDQSCISVTAPWLFRIDFCPYKSMLYTTEFWS